jgi:hypothetical protein
MPVYRFCFHGDNELVTGEEFHSCASDEAATQLAHVLLAKGPVVVVWRGERMLKRATRPGGQDVEI